MKSSIAMVRLKLSSQNLKQDGVEFSNVLLLTIVEFPCHLCNDVSEVSCRVYTGLGDKQVGQHLQDSSPALHLTVSILVAGRNI